MVQETLQNVKIDCPRRIFNYAVRKSINKPSGQFWLNGTVLFQRINYLLMKQNIACVHTRI